MRKGEAGCEGGDWGQKSSVNKDIGIGGMGGRLTICTANDEDMSIWKTPVKEDILTIAVLAGGARGGSLEANVRRRRR